MKILFRVDASNIIGTGHFMRCLSLGIALQEKNIKSLFVSRNPSKDFKNIMTSCGYNFITLTDNRNSKSSVKNHLYHSNWLDVSQEIDAKDTLEIVCEYKPDWIVVDHYALDRTWHEIIKNKCRNIMVIDDLGDRYLDCKILLDQNLNADKKKYEGKIPFTCNFLSGPKYALLRKEFKNWRQYSLARRESGVIKKILITMGGVDLSNHTVKVLKELAKSKCSIHCQFIVIIGTSYPHRSKLTDLFKSIDLNISVLSNVNNMAEIMAKSDLCIGTAGSTSWERCCLGLPSIVLSVAKNQDEIARALHFNKTAIYSNLLDLQSDFEMFFKKNGKKLLNKLTLNSKLVCDGLGAYRVIDQLEKIYEN